MEEQPTKPSPTDQDIKLSIVVPNFNSENYVGQFIDQILGQTYTNWELIFVDDGSTDKSMDVIEEYANRDERISLHRRTDRKKGADACRNIGMENATGEFICFFDSDDLLPVDSLERRVKELKAKPELDAVVFPAITFVNEPFDLKHLVLGIRLFDDDLEMFLKRYRLPFTVWTNVYRLKFLRDNDIKWDEDLMSMQDSDLNIRSLRKGMKYAFAEDSTPAYYWRIDGNPNSITKTIKKKSNLDSQLYFYNKLYDLFKGTKYEKALEKFGITILTRFAMHDYEAAMPKLLNRPSLRARYNLLRKIYRINVIKKLSIAINWAFFPIALSKHYTFMLGNKLTCRNYFKTLKSD